LTNYLLYFSYIYTTENSPKPFPPKSIKKLPSQILRYFFGNQTVNFNYGHKTCILGKVFWQNRFWTFFCPISIFPKYFPGKKQGSLLQSVAMKFSQKPTNPLHYVAFSPQITGPTNGNPPTHPGQQCGASSRANPHTGSHQHEAHTLCARAPLFRKHLAGIR
jgi:hypothetical protein